MFLKDQPFSKMAPPLPNPGSATELWWRNYS